ncbi:hypothetical protein KI387_038553, partial [Taxus chinensis]
MGQHGSNTDMIASGVGCSDIEPPTSGTDICTGCHCTVGPGSGAGAGYYYSERSGMGP